MVRNTQNAKAHKVKSTGGTSINKKLKILHSSVRGTVASALITQKVSRDEPTLLGLAPPPGRGGRAPRARRAYRGRLR